MHSTGLESFNYRHAFFTLEIDLFEGGRATGSMGGSGRDAAWCVHRNGTLGGVGGLTGHTHARYTSAKLRLSGLIKSMRGNTDPPRAEV